MGMIKRTKKQNTKIRLSPGVPRNDSQGAGRRSDERQNTLDEETVRKRTSITQDPGKEGREERTTGGEEKVEGEGEEEAWRRVEVGGRYGPPPAQKGRW